MLFAQETLDATHDPAETVARERQPVSPPLIRRETIPNNTIRYTIWYLS